MGNVSLEKAYLYEKCRLPYAPEAVDSLLEKIGHVDFVADIGSGTGQLARLFAGRCQKVYAVEPDASMRQVAQEVLSGSPAAKVVDAAAEETTLASDSIDLIVIGNAFHRFRPEACEELRRILREAGWVALFSYSFPNKPFTDMLFSKLSTLENSVGRTKTNWPRTPTEKLFGDCKTRTLSYGQSATEDWQTFFGAACAGIEAPERNEEDFPRFEEINREVFDAFSENGQIRIDYETRVQFGQPKV